MLEDGDVLLNVSVSDTGIGIPADKLDSIFDSFRQADSGLARRYTGMGLGLSVTQKLAKLMRAELSVTSEVGTGSTFTVNIPLRMPREFRRKSLGEQVRILLIDDLPVAQRGSLRMPNLPSFQLHRVSSPEEAMAAAARTKYDLILLDLQMPGLDQWTDSNYLQALQECSEAPVVGLTNQCTLSAYDRCFAAGMQGILPKPARAADLWPAVEHFLRNKPEVFRTGKAGLSEIAV